MASLRQKLKMAGGGLASTSLEEAEALTGQQSPTSPSQAAGIGASPDAAKMAGSKAQKTNALRTAIRGESELGRQTRIDQPRREQTAEEAAKTSTLQSSQTSLGDLKSRVEELAKSTLQAGLQKTTLTPAQLSTAAVSPELKPLLEKLKLNPNDQSTLAQIATQLGKKPGDSLTPDEVSGLLGSQSSQLRGLVAQSTADTLQVSQLPEDVKSAAAQLLNVDLSNMTTADLIDQIEAELAQEYNQVSVLEAQLANPALGPAERAAIQEQLRDLGAVGIRVAEDEATKLAGKIQKADTITFAGEEISVDKLLSDDYVAGLVKNYIDDPKSEASQMLAKSEPELMKFIDEFKPLLKTATDQLTAGVAELAATNQANKKLADLDLGGGVQARISDEIMQKIFPGWGTMTGEKYNPAASSFLTWAVNPSIAPSDKQAVISYLEANPDQADVITKLSDAELKKYFSGPARGNTITSLQDAKIIKNLPDVDPYPDTVAQVLGFSNISDMQKQVKEALHLATLRGAQGPLLNNLKILGIDPVNLNLNQVVATLKSRTPSEVRQLLGSRTGASLADEFVRDVGRSITPDEQITLQYAGEDGRLSDLGEVSNLSNKLFDALSPTRAAEFMKGNIYASLNAPSKNAFQKVITDTIQNQYGDAPDDKLFELLRSYRDAGLPAAVKKTESILNARVATRKKEADKKAADEKSAKLKLLNEAAKSGDVYAQQQLNSSKLRTDLQNVTLEDVDLSGGKTAAPAKQKSAEQRAVESTLIRPEDTFIAPAPVKKTIRQLTKKVGW